MSLKYRDILNDLYNGKIKTGIEATEKKAWFKYCYHFSHVENVISILNDGELLARSKATSLNKMAHDNASKKIIELTQNRYKDYVRLYFRPKSPTQYHNEGFKAKEELRISSLDAQCPVPVFLLFDIDKILNHPKVQFSEKGLAASGKVNLYNTPEEFSQLPFDKIFHDRAITESERESIVGHRHAEIIIPDKLNIDEYLRKIVVRSPAEKETLISLLSEELREKYSHMIQIDSTQNIFFKRWTYLDEVTLESSEIFLEFNVSSTDKPIQFDLNFEFEFEDSVLGIVPHSMSNWRATPHLILRFQSPKDAYRIIIKFDNHLMYSGQYKKEENIPY